MASSITNGLDQIISFCLLRGPRRRLKNSGMNPRSNLDWVGSVCSALAPLAAITVPAHRKHESCERLLGVNALREVLVRSIAALSRIDNFSRARVTNVPPATVNTTTAGVRHSA